MSLSADFPTTRPSLLLDFVNTQALDPRITFTRASSATYFDAAGVLQTAPAGQARFDYNPSTFAPLGLLIEEQRVNSIRNNTMQGAVAGSPGTTPTNWVQNVLASGLSRTVVGTGSTKGITWIDLQYQGTTTNANGYGLIFESTTGVAATLGQTWTGSAYLAISSGSSTNITSINTRITERDSGGAAILVSDIPVTLTSSLVRFTQTRTLTAASTAFVANGISMVIPSGVAIDITLRIGLPQLELGAFATSVIPTTTTAVTRNADAASMTGVDFSSWYNQGEGTLYTESVVARQVAEAGTGIALLAGSSGNLMVTFYRATGATGFIAQNNSVTQADVSPTNVLSANVAAKIATAFRLNDFASSGNGGVVLTDTSGTIPTITYLDLGIHTRRLNGYLRKVAYYPFRLTDSQLQALTS